jgi:hypothetical protein
MSKKIPSQDLVSKLDYWINTVLSQPNRAFGSLPACPYAKQAWMDNKVTVKECTGWLEAYSEIHTLDVDFSEKDVCLLVFKPDITPELLSNNVAYLNQFWSKSDYLTILEDHPDEREEVMEFNLNFGEHCLLFVQNRMKLQKARAELEKRGYYTHFTEEYKKEVQDR